MTDSPQTAAGSLDLVPVAGKLGVVDRVGEVGWASFGGGEVVVGAGRALGVVGEAIVRNLNGEEVGVGSWG